MIPRMFQLSSLSVLSSSATTYKIQRKILSATLKGENLTCVKPYFNFDNLIELQESENKMSSTSCAFIRLRLLQNLFALVELFTSELVFTCKPSKNQTGQWTLLRANVQPDKIELQCSVYVLLYFTSHLFSLL